MAQIVWTTDANGRVVEDSPSWRAFTGQNFEQFKDCGWLDVVHPDDRDPAQQAWLRTVTCGEISETEYRLRTANGEYRSVVVRSAPVRETDGGIREWVETGTDVTEHKRTARAPLFLPALVESASTAANGKKLDRNIENWNTGTELLGGQVAEEPSELIVRLRSDEFAIVVPDRNRASSGGGLAGKVLRVLAEPFDLNGQQARSSASIGITIGPLDQNDPKQLVHNADMTMYRGMIDNHHTHPFFAPKMNVEVQRRRAFEKELRLALDRQELVLHYQPQVDLGTRHLVGLEALVRWQHPERGLLGPLEFIGVAEESGLIAPLGRWVLQEAATQCKTWLDAGLPAVRIAVNTSMFQFRQGDMVQIVARIIDQAGLAACFLGLELTESVLMHNLAALSGDLHRLHRMGIELSIDDFGTGYSSLAYLQRLPVDRLKIDRSFVRDIELDASSAIITEAIITLGRSLGIKVLAEGVETEAQIDFLREKGCDEIQGYHLSIPVPAADVPPLLVIGAGRLSGHSLRKATAGVA
jgi:PAS domain S-box-containing protein